MFGRKGLKTEPSRFAAEPRPEPEAADGQMDANVDAAIAMLSQAIGIDLDFDNAYLFAPSLWNIPQIGAMLTRIGLRPDQAGNRIALLKNPASVAKIAAMPADDPIRTVLSKSRFGVVLYNPDAENGYADGLLDMQREKLWEFATRPDLTEDARKYATFDLMMFSEGLLMGKVALG